MNEQNLNLLKEKYGKIASWAIWNRPTGSPKSEMGDISFFESRKETP